jgi:hypothetical protein
MRGRHAPQEGPWGAPRAGGPLARALSQARERRALQRRSDALPVAGDASVPPPGTNGQALADEMAALAREAQARDPERTVGEPLRHGQSRRSRSRSGRGVRGRALRWSVLAVSGGIVAVTAIAVARWMSNEAPSAEEGAGLRLDQQLSAPGSGPKAQD